MAASGLLLGHFCQIHLQLATGPVVMLHAGLGASGIRHSLVDIL